MNGIRLQDIAMLHGMWLLPLLAAVFLYAAWRRRQALTTLIGAGLIGRIPVSASAGRRRAKAALILAAVLLTVLALPRPGWHPKSSTMQRTGRDVVFLLDVSRSMLAEDLRPNRMERAKLAILDCVEQLQGDRVALVAFAGTAAVKCPLTLDYGFFRMMLDDVGLDSIARGGTMIGDAIRKVTNEVFDDRTKEYKDIILITDGGDQDSFPVDAAKAAGERGIRLIALGLGEEREGTRVPVKDEQGRRDFLKYQGREVWSRLDGDLLAKMASLTPGGQYLPVGTGTIDLGEVYRKLIAGSGRKRELESPTVTRYEEKFQIFLGLAFVLLAAEAALGERRRRKTRA